MPNRCQRRPSVVCRALSIAASAVLAQACAGGGGELGPAAGIVELTPELAADAPVEVAEEIYVALGVPPSVEPWRVDAPRVEVRPLPGPGGEVADALMLWGSEEKRVVVPGSFDPQHFDHVRVGLLVRSTSRVRVSFLRGGKVALRSSWIPVMQSELAQSVTVSLAHDPFDAEPFDALEILLPAELGGPVCVHSVELLNKPLAAWVLGPEGGPRLARVGHEYRLGHGLGGPLRRTVRFRAERGASLRFSYALAPELHAAGQRATLRVTLSAQGAPLLVEELPLESASRKALRWHSAAVALDELAGREIDLSMELDGGPLPAYGYVGELRVVRESRTAPAVLLVTSDTHRADHVGAAAPELDARTPVLDALAERGVLFERCYSTSNLTLPSHSALMTGLHPRDTRIVDNQTPLAEQAHTLAGVFRARGWRTLASVAAIHLGPDRSGLAQGFERYSAPVSETIRRGEDAVADVLSWLGDVEGEPLFVWLHLFDAHMPYDPPDGLEQRFLGGALAHSTDGAALRVLGAKMRLQRARYLGEVSYLDSQLGRLLSLPRFQDGIVAVTSDHGECLGQHGIDYAHEGLYPDTVQVPLILAWPEAAAGARVALPIQHLGLGRTLLDLAGMAEEPFPGRSLLEALEPEARGEPIFALAFGARSASVTHGTWHLILHLADDAADEGSEPGGRARHEVELYELAGDPACESDLSALRREETRTLRAVLVRWLASAESLGLAAERKPEFQAALEALGYTGASPPSDGPWIDPECGCEPCLAFR